MTLEKTLEDSTLCVVTRTTGGAATTHKSAEAALKLRAGFFQRIGKILHGHDLRQRFIWDTNPQ